MSKRVTVDRLAEELIAVFGAKGTTREQYRKYLKVRSGSIPKNLSRLTVPSGEGKRERVDPFSIAEWYLQYRKPGGNWIES
jgi:hypothetical protein